MCFKLRELSIPKLDLCKGPKDLKFNFVQHRESLVL